MPRLLLLAEVANAATLLASDRASAMTAVLASVTCGSFADLWGTEFPDGGPRRAAGHYLRGDAGAHQQRGT